MRRVDLPTHTDTDMDWQSVYEDALDRLPWRAPIYLPTEKMPLSARAQGMTRVADIHNERVFTVYADKLKDLRRKYQGAKRAFIIGNGPSLNKTDLHMLKDEITFCVNGFFLKMPELDWTPTFYVVEDHLVAEDRADAINALKGPTKLFPTYLGYCLDESEDTIFFNHRARKSYPNGFDFSTDASAITYTGCTVTFTCMQLAFYLGVEEIYLIGVDADYAIPADAVEENQYGTGVIDMASDDVNHFHPDYFGKGYRWHDPQVGMMLEAYAEARRVTDSTDTHIYNATVGGKLEVFERRAFQDIFPEAITPEQFASLEEMEDADRLACLSVLRQEQATRITANAPRDFPRALTIDMTNLGGMTATGELKSALFEGWPKSRMMQVFANGHTALGVAGWDIPEDYSQLGFEDAQLIASLVSAFDPDVILYRPVPDKPGLHKLAMELIRRLDAPLVTWIVDDWPERMRQAQDPDFTRMDRDLRELFARANVNLSISDAMSKAFKTRYGVDFHSVANGINPEEWTAPITAKPADAPFIIRYSGGLAEDMTLSSLLDIAQAVESLSAEIPIHLEINTRDHWVRLAGHHFEKFKATTLYSNPMVKDDYYRWLSEADVLLIALNFDAKTRDYLQYSVANKLPECLAAGSLVLGYGPRGLATIDLLTESRTASLMTFQSMEKLTGLIRTIYDTRDKLPVYGAKAREYAFTHFNIADRRDAFQTHLCDAAKTRITAAYDGDAQAVLEQLAQTAALLAAPSSQHALLSSRRGRGFQLDLASGAPAGAPRPQSRAGRISEIVGFFAGWRAIPAALSIAASAFPLLLALIIGPSSPMLIFALCGSLGATLILLFLFSYIATLLLRESRRLEQMIEYNRAQTSALRHGVHQLVKHVNETNKP